LSRIINKKHHLLSRADGGVSELAAKKKQLQAFILQNPAFTNSTRLFLARPSSVSLEAAGAEGPTPIG